MKTIVNIVILFLDWLLGLKARYFGAESEVAATSDVVDEEAEKKLWKDRFSAYTWKMLSSVLRGKRVKLLADGNIPQDEKDEIREIFMKMDKEVERPNIAAQKAIFDKMCNAAGWLKVREAYDQIVELGVMSNELYRKIFKVLRMHSKDLATAREKVMEIYAECKAEKTAQWAAIQSAKLAKRREFTRKVELWVTRVCTGIFIFTMLSTGFTAGRMSAHATTPTTPAPAVVSQTTTPTTTPTITPSTTPTVTPDVKTAPEIIKDIQEEPIGDGHVTKEYFDKNYPVDIEYVDAYTYKVAEYEIKMPQWFGNDKDLIITQTSVETNDMFPHGLNHVTIVNPTRGYTFDVQIVKDNIYKIGISQFDHAQFPDLAYNK